MTPERLKAYRELQEESELQEKGFDLRRAADQRAIKRWQGATDRTLVLPDHADLCVWLMEQHRELQAKYDLLRRAVNENDTDCLPECSSMGHADGCQYVDVAATLQVLQAKYDALWKAATGRIDGAALCDHGIPERVFHQGRIYCFACIREALKPWKEDSK